MVGHSQALLVTIKAYCNFMLYKDILFNCAVPNLWQQSGEKAHIWVHKHLALAFVHAWWWSKTFRIHVDLGKSLYSSFDLVWSQNLACLILMCPHRDPEIWRSACLRVWGRGCTKLLPFTSWREMFLERPRVRFDGKQYAGVFLCTFFSLCRCRH